MAVSNKRKTKPEGGRTEVFALRLDPKLKYMAELAARKQRRSLANYVEWALDTALRETIIDDKTGSKVWEEAEALWDISEHGRFFRLMEAHPELMSYDEQKILYSIKNYAVDDPNWGVTLRYCTEKGKLLKRQIIDSWKEIVSYTLDPNAATEKSLQEKMFELLSPDPDA
jgi:hypothetical protein